MKVKSLRKQKNWSQEQLAEVSGVSVRTIQRIEKGEMVGMETIKSLASVLEVDANELKAELKQSSDTATTGEAEMEATKVKHKTMVHLLVSLSVMLVAYLIFFLPNYGKGENQDALVFIAILMFVGWGIYAYFLIKSRQDKAE